MTSQLHADSDVRARRASTWQARIAAHRERAVRPVAPLVEGKLVRMVGLTLEAVGFDAAVGERCEIRRPDRPPILADVVGFSSGRLLMMPIGEVQGVAPNAPVVPTGQFVTVTAGDAVLGRVLDAAGRPIDGRGALGAGERVPLNGEAINPLTRRPVEDTLDVGIRSINALLTIGRGQRVGVFAPSGVGKSVLLGMMARYTSADRVVVGLIGERGREVNDFITCNLGPTGLRKAVVVASPADDSALLRLQGAMLATRLAEQFRSQGHQVLLLLDSLTRYAQAQREVALAIGEPPATRGYPPSVFAMLPKLVERAGNTEQTGGITAFYTVLAEGDDADDPISEAARAVIDGHLVLSRRLAERGHFPAIDLEASASRTMAQVASVEHQALARRFRRLGAVYEASADLIEVGAYVPGVDLELDEAVQLRAALQAFLTQDVDESIGLSDSIAQLEALLQGSEPRAAAVAV